MTLPARVRASWVDYPDPTAQLVVAAELDAFDSAQYELRRREISVADKAYGATGVAGVDATTRVQAAIDDCYSDGGGTVILPGRQYDHTGLTLPAGGLVSLRGVGRRATILNLTSTSAAAAITEHGASGGTTASNFTLERLHITAAAKTTGQHGLDLKWCSSYVLDRLEIDTFDIGVYDDTTWYSETRGCQIHDCNDGIQIPAASAGTATPKDYFSTVIRACATRGFYIADKADRIGYWGGGIENCGIGAQIDGNNTRNVVFQGVNFEDNTTNHVRVGTAGGPVVVAFRSCRFWSSGSPIGLCINVSSVQQLEVQTCGFQNATKAISVPAASAVYLANNRPASVTTYATIGALTFTGNQRLLAGTDTVMFGDVQAAVATKTANYTITTADRMILADTTTSNVTVTLPTSVGRTGVRFTVKRVTAGANTCTLATTASQTIDGATTVSMPTQWDMVEVESDGANWQIVAVRGSALGL